jgi:hypothetical protein
MLVFWLILILRLILRLIALIKEQIRGALTVL